jgi:hypothetical protein
MSGSRATCRAILLLVAAASAHAIAVPRAQKLQTPSLKTPGGQSIESLFPGLLAKVDRHDLQLQQLRAENAELRKSFGDMRRNCTKVEEEVRTVRAETASLVRVDRRRKLQETNRCTGESLQAMLQVCCAGGEGAGGHRRFLQGQGCDAIPSSCSASCGPAFVDYYEGCQGIIEALEADERADFDTLYGECKESEQAKAVMLAGATPAMMFKMEIVETDSEQVRAPSRVRNPAQKMLPVWEPARNASRVRTPPPPENATAGREETLTAPSAQAAAEMLGGLGRPVLLPPGGGLPPPRLGDPGASSGEHQPPRQGEGGSGAAVGVSEFRRVCSRANLTACAPPCNPASDGFLLSVRGRDCQRTA